MDGNEIRLQMNKINEELIGELDKFILTNHIKSLLKQKEELQHLCHHTFNKGICKYCDLKENDL